MAVRETVMGATQISSRGAIHRFSTVMNVRHCLHACIPCMRPSTVTSVPVDRRSGDHQAEHADAASRRLGERRPRLPPAEHVADAAQHQNHGRRPPAESVRPGWLPPSSSPGKPGVSNAHDAIAKLIRSSCQGMIMYETGSSRQEQRSLRDGLEAEIEILIQTISSKI